MDLSFNEFNNEARNQEDDQVKTPAKTTFTDKQAILFCLLVASCWTSVGYALAFDSNAQIVYERSSIMTTGQTDYFGPIAVVGAILGSLISGLFIVDGIGHRTTVVLGDAIFCLGWLLHIYVLTRNFDNKPSMNFHFLVFCRILIGIAIGILSQVTPMYIGEITPPYLRQVLGILPCFFINFGVFFSNLIGYGMLILDYNDSLLPKANNTIVDDKSKFLISLTYAPLVGFIIALLNIVITSFCPYIRKRGILVKSINTEITQSHNPDNEENTYVVSEAAKNSTFTRRISISLWAHQKMMVLRQPKVRKQIFLGVACMFFSNGLGLNAILYHSTNIFEKLVNVTSGVEMKESTLSTINGAVLLLGVISTYLGGAFLKKKTLFYISSAFVVICHLAFGVVLLLKIDPTGGAIVLLIVFVFSFDLAWAATPWLIMSEIFDDDAKSIGSGITSASNYLFYAVFAFSYVRLQELTTPYVMFFFYMCVSLVSLIYIFLGIPETKWKTGEEIQQLFI